ncbi:MAG: amino acid ABC transporter permease [Pseudomonadota bacterium]|nr:amino acid ABC transporter permease [Pseudomonadota bacterium]
MTGRHGPGAVLAVLLPQSAALSRGRALPMLRLKLQYAAVPLAMIMLGASGNAANGPAQAGALAVLERWTPLLLRGFAFNILISVLSMFIGTVLGLVLGLWLVAPNRPLRTAGVAITEFFRNAPWLVLLFFVTFLLPFQFKAGSLTMPFPGWQKAVVGLALPVMANVAEIVRGAMLSISPGQWEAAESLGFTRRQQVWRIILPQCVTRMIPPWMNLYAILIMSTTLASIVGVSEVVTLAGQVQAAEGGRPELLASIYGYVLLMFFLYSYPISVWTRRLERRFAER